jgi:hypothetical protein
MAKSKHDYWIHYSEYAKTVEGYKMVARCPWTVALAEFHARMMDSVLDKRYDKISYNAFMTRLTYSISHTPVSFIVFTTQTAVGTILMVNGVQFYIDHDMNKGITRAINYVRKYIKNALSQ